MGTADMHLAICLRASVAHDTVRFTFSFFPVLYYSISFSFVRIFTFPCLHLRIHYFFVNRYFVSR